MKLNLLPTYVSKEGQAKTATVVSILLGVLGIATAVGMILYSQQTLARNKAEADSLVQPAQDALDTSKRADEIMQGAVVIDRNLKLANAMLKHNTVYPDLYREVMTYVPSFMRVTTLTAAPNSPEQATITIGGVLQSFQQYADVVIALLRMPGVTNVARADFNVPVPAVPALSETDQNGLPVLPSEGNLPSDPVARMEELAARASAAPRGFLGQGGFGTEEALRGAMPDWSPVTLTVTISRNIQTPDPRATLAAQGAAGAAPPGGSFAGGGAPPPPPTGRAGRGRLAEDED